jgi:hypothetical protein
LVECFDDVDPICWGVKYTYGTDCHNTRRTTSSTNKNNKMTLYIRRESSKLWKRFCSEISTEIGLLAENWKYLLAGLICQYIHGLAAKGVHYIHRPGPTLQDLGFFLLPVCLLDILSA